MKVSQIPLKYLQVGDRVISSQGTHGTITFISDYIDREDYVLTINWDNGNVTPTIWHFWCDMIQHMDL